MTDPNRDKYAVSNPPGEFDWGLRWVGWWQDRKINLFTFKSAGRRVSNKDNFIYNVLLSGEARIEIDDKQKIALPNALYVVQPGQSYRIIPVNGPCNWLMWYKPKEERV